MKFILIILGTLFFSNFTLAAPSEILPKTLAPYYVQCGPELYFFKKGQGKEVLKDLQANGTSDFKYKNDYFTFRFHFDFLSGKGTTVSMSNGAVLHSCSYVNEADRPTPENLTVHFCFNNTARIDTAILDGQTLKAQDTFLGLTAFECGVRNKAFEYLKKRKKYFEVDPNSLFSDGNPAIFSVETTDLRTFLDLYLEQLDFTALNANGDNFIHARNDLEGLKIFLNAISKSEIKKAVLNLHNRDGLTPSFTAALTSMDKFLFLAGFPETDKSEWKKNNLWAKIAELRPSDAMRFIKGPPSMDPSLLKEIIEWNDLAYKNWRSLLLKLDKDAVFAVYESPFFNDIFFSGLDGTSICKILIPKIGPDAEPTIERILKNKRFDPACRAIAQAAQDRIEKDLFSQLIWSASWNEIFDLERMVKASTIIRNNEIFLTYSGFKVPQKEVSLGKLENTKYCPRSIKLESSQISYSCSDTSISFDLNLIKMPSSPNPSIVIQQFQKVSDDCYNVQVEDLKLGRTVLIQNAYLPVPKAPHSFYTFEKTVSAIRVQGFFDGYTLVRDDYGDYGPTAQLHYLMPNTKCGDPKSALPVIKNGSFWTNAITSKIFANPIPIDNSAQSLIGSFSPKTRLTYVYSDSAQYALPTDISTDGIHFYSIAAGASEISKYRALSATSLPDGHLALDLELISNCEIPDQFPARQTLTQNHMRTNYLVQPTVGLDQNDKIQFATLVYQGHFVTGHYGTVDWIIRPEYEVKGFSSVCKSASGRRTVQLQMCGKYGCYDKVEY